MNLIAFIPTHDYDAARTFYVDTLGLQFVTEDGFALVLDSDGTMIRVVKIADYTPPPFTVLGWQAEDIEAAVRSLAAKGVTFERYGFLEQDALGIWTAPSGDKVAWFKDPTGNTLSFSQHV